LCIACPDCSLGEVTKPAPPRGPQPRCTASLAGRRGLTEGRDDSRRRSPPPNVRTTPMRPSPEGSRRHTSPLQSPHPECLTRITFTPPRVQGDDVQRGDDPPRSVGSEINRGMWQSPETRSNECLMQLQTGRSMSGGWRVISPSSTLLRDVARTSATGVTSARSAQSASQRSTEDEVWPRMRVTWEASQS